MIRVRLETKSFCREYAFHRKEVRVGRSPLNDLPIAIEGVSARHGVMRLTGDTLTFEDLDSLSGTTLIRNQQGTPLTKPLILHHGDTLLLGRHARLTLLSAGGEATLTLTHQPHSPPDFTTPTPLLTAIFGLGLTQHRQPGPDTLLQELSAILTQHSPQTIKGLGLLRCEDELVQMSLLSKDGHLTPAPLNLRDNTRRGLIEQISKGGVTHHPHQNGWRLYCTANHNTRPQELVLVLELSSDTITNHLTNLQPILQPLADILSSLLREEKLAQQLETTQAENRYFRDRQRRHYLYKDLVTQSRAMRDVYQRLNTLVSHQGPVLITGESGTGKEMLARALHHLGARNEHLMVSQSCADQDPVLLDIELFGAGSNTHAGPRPSVFELAQGGTVFLDEVDRLPPLLQLKLLRVIKEGEVRRHSEEFARPVQMRLVVATHRELGPLVEDGIFRRDLSMALREQELALPPLRDRREDIIPLARIFMAVFARRYGSPPSTLTPEAHEPLLNYTWPGNVRELQSAIELAVLKRKGKTLRTEDFGLS